MVGSNALENGAAAGLNLSNSELEVKTFQSPAQLAQAAAAHAASLIRQALESQGEAAIIAATGRSQVEFLDALAQAPQIDWSKTTFFHLDEYIGLPRSHPAGFRTYLRERIVDRVHPGEFHFINGEEANAEAECRRLAELISERRIDLALSGVGDNGHLAFNDPPADFETKRPFLVVELDETSRRQQLRQGWFQSLEEVPQRAITMSVQQILKSSNILCLAFGSRKAEIVRACLELEVSPWRPASILQRHGRAFVYLDLEAASLLNHERFHRSSGQRFSGN